MPGIDEMGVRVLSPSVTKIGQIRSSTDRVFSATSRRDQPVARLRRMRTAGKLGAEFVSAGGTTVLEDERVGNGFMAGGILILHAAQAM
jgi:hypothetical protein